MKADLHVHTNISDGSMDLEEVIALAIKNGVTHLGITNHDTVKGLSEAIHAGKRAGIKVIPGIEISAWDSFTKRKVHILGFNFNEDGKNIKKLCDPILERRHNNSLWQIDKLLSSGYSIDVESIYLRAEKSGVIYKQHIMAELIDKKYSDAIYSDLYIRLFKGEGICAKDIEYVDAIRAVQAIKADDGIAILAHPGQLNSYSIIDKLVAEGLDGIELYHEDHNEEDHKKITEYCSRFALIATGGTDFHGTYGETNISIGDIACPEQYIHLF